MSISEVFERLSEVVVEDGKLFLFQGTLYLGSLEMKHLSPNWVKNLVDKHG